MSQTETITNQVEKEPMSTGTAIIGTMMFIELLANIGASQKLLRDLFSTEKGVSADAVEKVAKIAPHVAEILKICNEKN